VPEKHCDLLGHSTTQRACLTKRQQKRIRQLKSKSPSLSSSGGQLLPQQVLDPGFFQRQDRDLCFMHAVNNAVGSELLNEDIINAADGLLQSTARTNHVTINFDLEAEGIAVNTIAKCLYDRGYQLRNVEFDPANTEAMYVLLAQTGPTVHAIAVARGQILDSAVDGPVPFTEESFKLHCPLLLRQYQVLYIGRHLPRPPSFYSVEGIAGRRVASNGNVEYLIKWSGTDSSENTWLSLTELGRCRELIEEYENKK